MGVVWWCCFGVEFRSEMGYKTVGLGGGEKEGKSMADAAFNIFFLLGIAIIQLHCLYLHLV